MNNVMTRLSILLILPLCLVVELVEASSQDNIEHIVVSSSRYNLMADAAGSTNTFSKESIEQMPHLADDVFRLLPYIPGTSAGDYSANFNIRGGDKDELLVLFDGQQLYRPFHMKSFFSALSIIDINNVGNINFSSGGFDASYGNKMSGVMDITSVEPLDKAQYGVGISFVNARAGAEGSFNNGRGRWIASVRRGYLDLILDAIGDGGDNVQPTYADMFTKVQYELNEDHELSAHFLHAYDDELFENEFYTDENIKATDSISGSYGSTYFWLKLNSELSYNISLKNQLGIGEVDEDRNGRDYDSSFIDNTDIRVSDYRKLQFVELHQTLSYRMSESQFWQFGWNARSLAVDYQYNSSTLQINEPILPAQIRDIVVEKEGNEYGMFINQKFRISKALASEVGVRYDKQNYMRFDDAQWSPRASLAYQISPDSTLRMSWGKYSQAQDILSLQVSDGISEFAEAEHAEHRIVSIESRLMDNVNVRAEVYQKSISDPKPRYENLYDPFSFFPEGQNDRIRIAPDSAEISGAELTVTHRVNDKFNWSGNYSWSDANDVIDGQRVRRSWEQEHSINIAVNYAFDNGWHINSIFHYHSGWPTTEMLATSRLLSNGNYEITPYPGPRNAVNLGAYHRIDVRLSKTEERQHSRLTWFFEVTNLLNRKNECCMGDPRFSLDANGNVSVFTSRSSWLPIIPSFGVNLEF